MGLQGQLSDVSSDSLPLMLLSLLPEFLSRLRSYLLPPCDSASNLSLDDGSMIASGLANIIVFEQRFFGRRTDDLRGGVFLQLSDQADEALFPPPEASGLSAASGS